MLPQTISLLDPAHAEEVPWCNGIPTLPYRVESNCVVENHI